MFDGATHVPLATLPGMRERTLTISSGGKTFSTTGWKIGWACGPAPLVAATRTAKQFLTYVNGAPFQPAIAVGLGLDDAFFAGLGRRPRGQEGPAGRRTGGGRVHRPPARGHLLHHRRHPPRPPDGDGLAFCRSLPERCGVVAVPDAVFYERPEPGATWCASPAASADAVLDEAAERLAGLAR